MNHFEIEACVIRAKNGNKEELLKLFEQYEGFIFKTARSYNIKGYDQYDLAQIGYITLMKAVEKYRGGSNRFSTYAFNAIKNNFNKIVRNNKRNTEELSLNNTVNAEGSEGGEFIESLEAPDNVEEEALLREEVRKLRKAVSKLPYDELNFILMVYYHGATLPTYAKKAGLTYIQAVRKRDRVLKKLGIEMRKNKLG